MPLIEDNYNNYFQKIFEVYNKDFIFNDKVTVAKSIENFQNLIYENCKLTDFKNIDKKVIISYLFLLDNFKQRIINAIYQTILSPKNNKIFEDLFNYFLLAINGPEKSTKISFDNIYFNKWMENTLKEKPIDDDNKINSEEFNYSKIKINFQKYSYYGPDEVKSNFVVGDKKNIPKNKVILYTPDYLIQNKILQEYNTDNFQIFNSNNICPDIFSFTLKEGIEALNKKLKGEMVDK